MESLVNEIRPEMMGFFAALFAMVILIFLRDKFRNKF